ncbi:MAG: tetratricopeptide repeat protein, partial [Planctomycetes bacterium]|nr:tetratricopeptide repeat protein [Planctomycetota bacterium]
EMIDALSVRIEKEPRRAELYLQRGEMYREHGDWDGAMADFERAARLDPDLAGLDLARGRTLLDAGWVQFAELVLTSYVGGYPTDARGHDLLGEALERRARFLPAAAEFAKAIETDPQPTPERYIAQARALAAAGEEHVPEALAALDAGIRRLGKPIVSVQVVAIDLELRRRNYDAALARVQTLADQSARKEQWHFRRGDVLRRAGRADEAREAYRQALAAIDKLSPARRQTPSVRELAANARAALEELTPASAATRPAPSKEQSDANKSTAQSER